MDETQPANQLARAALAQWQADIKTNVYAQDPDYIHSIQFYFPQEFSQLDAELNNFGEIVATQLEPLVQENNLKINLPRLDAYNSIGERIDKVVHHPTYVQAGELIYRTGLLEKMAKPGGLLECLSFLFLSSQVGEAGHNCPIACSAGMIRTLQNVPDFPKRNDYLAKLISPDFTTNFTGAQFLTEIQGGSDVGLNATYAESEQDVWRIHGEKWFCSNAGANLLFVSARFNPDLPGTKGLGLFLVPAEWQGHKNHYTLRRLKDKIGTCSMATGEIDFQGAFGLAMGSLEEGFHLAMQHVLHLSRLFNSFCVLGMARRAYTIAYFYAKNRIAFTRPISNYPLVKEHLAGIKAENTAMLAGLFATTRLQDQLDTKTADKKEQLLLRLLVNIQKYFTAKWSVQHIHHALDILAGNGAIESFSSIPRLLRDCIVCENWEGTHNVLRAQVLKDILKYQVDQLYLEFMRQQLNQLTLTEEKQKLFSALTELEQKLTLFRTLAEELQSLQIQTIVDQMAMIYSALMLLIEAVDQEKTAQSSSKLNCYHYFYLLHVAKKDLVYDSAYLELITKIIA